MVRCQLSSPASVINSWRSAAMLITSTVEICIQHLGRVEEMVFAARRSYASAVLGVVILSVCYMRALWLIQGTYRRYFYTTWKGNASSQMWFFVQLCSSWQDFNWLKGLCGLSAAAELLVAQVAGNHYNKIKMNSLCSGKTTILNQDAFSDWKSGFKKSWFFKIKKIRFFDLNLIFLYKQVIQGNDR